MNQKPQLNNNNFTKKNFFEFIQFTLEFLHLSKFCFHWRERQVVVTQLNRRREKPNEKTSEINGIEKKYIKTQQYIDMKIVTFVRHFDFFYIHFD